MKVIGFHPSEFHFDDGRSSLGTTLYLSTPVTAQGGAGVVTERVYLSNNKLNGYIPMLGDEILIERSNSGSHAVIGVHLLRQASQK